MLLFVDRHNGTPVYRQIIDQVRFQIASGALKGGDELPSTRALSAELGLNPMTVSKAYATLEGEGVLERRPGLPLVVARSEEEQTVEARLAELRRTLDPAARIAAQLGLPRDQILDTFRELLAERERDGETQ
jgi:GntR family transcriptional regulator